MQSEGSGAPFDINAHQEAEFHLSIYHYFLWKAALEKSKGKGSEASHTAGALNGGSAAVSPSVIELSDSDDKQAAPMLEKDSNAENLAAASTENSTNSSKDGASASRPITPADAAVRVDAFQRVADALEQQFPQQVQFFTSQFHAITNDPMSKPPPPPVVTTLYQDFPRLQTELATAQNRIDQLERAVLTKHYETVTLTNELTRVKLQISMPAASVPAAPTVAVAPTKRKDPPKTATTESSSKRPKLSEVAAKLGALKAAAAGLKLQAMAANTKKRGSSGPPKDSAVTQAGEASETPAPPKRFVPFEERVQELDHFRKGNGHCRVPNSLPGLGRWVQDMRRYHRDSKLSKEHVAILEAMGFEWSVKEPSVPWEQRFEVLKAFKAEFGHCNVSRGYKKDPRLGEFVHMQRNGYRLNNRSLMEAPEGGGKSRAQQLEEIGFVWHTGKLRPTFEDRIEECRDFRRQHDHLQVPLPAKYDGDDPPESAETRSFCTWAQRQRDEYRRFNDGKKTTLNKSRIRKLDEMGFDWKFDEKSTGTTGRGKLKDNVLFNSRIAQLAEINEKFGDCNDINILRAAGHPETSALYQWMKRQRKAWKALHAGQWTWLDPERIALLESVKFNFEPYKHRLPYGSRKSAPEADTQTNVGHGKPLNHTLPVDHTNPSSDEDEDDDDEGSCPSIDNERYRTSM